MNIALLVMDLFLGDSLSLKDKRRIMGSLTQRLRRSFNIALCEVEHQERWQRSKIAIVLINTNWRMLEESASKIITAVERDGRVQVLNTEMERIR